MQRYSVIGILIAMACLSMVLLTARSLSMRNIDHDDWISYLAATGHMGEFIHDGPRNQWVAAEEWQRLWLPEAKGCFGRIARDLCDNDIHPPLYFWLLHLWILLIGMHLWTGHVLNAVLMLVTAIVLFRLMRRLEISLSGTYAGVLFILVNASTQDTMTATRQYTLLTFAVTVMMLTAVNGLRTGRFRWWLMMTVSASAAFLTQFQAVVTLSLFAAGLVFAYVRIQPGARHRIILENTRFLTGIPAVIIAAAVPLIVFPRLLLPILHQQGDLKAPFELLSGYRWKRIIHGLRHFVFSERVLDNLPRDLNDRIMLIAIAVSAGVLAGLPLLERVESRKIESRNTNSRCIRRFVIFTASGQIGLVFLLYLSGCFPIHAMGGRYLMLPSVFTALLLAMFADRIRERGRCNSSGQWFLAGFLMLVTANTVMTTWSHTEIQRHAVKPPEMYAEMPVMTMAVTWGILPAILWDLHSQTPVYAAVGHALRQDPHPDVYAYPDFLLVSRRALGLKEDEASRVIEVFRRYGYRRMEVIGTVNGRGSVTRLHRPGPVHQTISTPDIAVVGAFSNMRCQEKLLFSR